MSSDLARALNPEQLRTVQTHEGPLLTLAGAGSGKTRVITYRVADLLRMGVPRSAILTVTFTNKAAREMALRVKVLCGKKLPRLTVCTFHAFGVQVLRQDAAALGYRPNFSIYDESDREALLKEAAREIGLARGGRADRTCTPRRGCFPGSIATRRSWPAIGSGTAISWSTSSRTLPSCGRTWPTPFRAL